MKRLHWTIATGTVLALSAAAAAEPSPLAQVPASAAMVIHINGPDALESHVSAFLKEAVPDQAAAAKAGLESMFRGEAFFAGERKLLGLARDGHVFLVFLDAKLDGPPTPAMAFLLPAKYAEFREGFLKPEERKASKIENGYEAVMMNGQPTFLVDRKGYVAIAATKEVAETFVKNPPGLDGKLSKDQADRLLRSDLGLYLDGEAFAKQYADALKDAHKLINDALDQMEQKQKAQKGQWEAERAVCDWLFQAVDDGQALLVAGELRANGGALHAEALLKPESKTAAGLKDSRPSAFRDLARMPAGQIYYGGWQTGAALSKLLGPLQFAAGIDPDSEAAKAAQEALDRLAEAKPGSRLQCLTRPPAGVLIWEYEDPQKAVAAQTRLLESLRPGDYCQYGLLREKPEIKPKVVRYRNMDMTYAHIVFDLDRMTADLPEPARRPALAGLKKLIGEGMSFWYGSDGKNVVQATDQDWASAKRQLDQYFASDGPVGKDESFADVRKELPPEANALALIDAVQLVGSVLDFVRPIAEATGGPAKMFPPVKGKPAFAGAALTLRPDRVDADVFVSADAVKQLYKPLSPIFPFLPF